jgi:hypothetical protein
MAFTSRQMPTLSTMLITFVAIEITVTSPWMVYNLTCGKICNHACMLSPIMSKVGT